MLSRTRRGLLPLFVLAAAAIASLGGCEDDTKPVITKFFATPECDVVSLHTRVTLDDQGNVVKTDTLGVYLEVSFFARASSGNRKADPTGANSPLEWTWDFGDGKTAKNVVNPTHLYYGPYYAPDDPDSTTPLPYTVTLTVQDDDGDEDTQSLQILVGEQYGDLDVLRVDVIAEPQIRFQAVPGSVSVALESFGRQFRPAGWNMDFRGELETDCTVSGLFEQYQWDWSIINLENPADTVKIFSRNPARLTLGTLPGGEMRYRQYQADLTVTETVTGISRTKSGTQSRNPVGLRVGFSVPEQTVPNVSDALALEAYFLQGVTEISFGLDFDTNALEFDRIDLNSFFGVTLEVDATVHPVQVTLTNLPDLASVTNYRLGDILFNTKDVAEGYYPVRIRDLRAVRPEEGNSSALAPVSFIDGGVNLGADCDGDFVPDAFALEYYPGIYDCDRNGRIDSCEITEAKDDLASTDADQNGEPDIDNDGDGVLDSCQ